MCGIAGIFELDARREACPNVLERMLTAIYHRGPDEDGRLIDRELAMGMRRLSIIDLADGQQPIFDESGRYAVVFNGEIYNYVELREDLLRRGHTLRTKSDTEVIVHLFEEHGAECVQHLRGMFALAVWDSHERSLFIARDRLGIKPLYYAQRQSKLLFGSEIKSLLQHPALSASLDRRGLSEFLSLKYVPAPRTMFAGINSLPPGHFLKVQSENVSVGKYWDVSFANHSEATTEYSEQDYVERLGELLRESVRLRLRSDVPFGAFLSGGLDSSVIVALMAESMSQRVKTFSVGFEESDGRDELPFAREVANRFGCEHHTLSITAKDFLDHAEDVLWHLDQPIADQATVATHMVSKLARKHVKMVLTGEGGDELFAGYARYRGEQWSDLSSRIPASAGRLLRHLSRKLPGMRRGKIAIGALTQRDEHVRFANWFPMFSDDAKAELLADWPTNLSLGASGIFAEHLQNCDATESLNRMLYCDTKAWLPDYLLLRGDKLTMANSLEARLPLLDHHLVEFAASLPANMKLRGKTGKYLLKQFASQLLPDSVVNRPKQGFPIPIDRWLRKEAKPLVRDMLSPASVQRRGLFNPAAIERMLSQHESGYADFATEIWGLVSVEMWHRRFIDSSLSDADCSPTVAEATTLAPLAT